MATVQNIFTNQASLDKAKEIMRDKMDVDKQEYLNIQDVKLSMCKMILDNNFIKINKKFETAYIDSETYQENTIKDMTLLLPDKLTAVTNEGNKQVTDIGNKVESVKTEITKLTDTKKSQLSTLITNATADIASANNPVGYKNGTEIILKDEVVLEGDVYLSIPNTAHYANYKSNGISLISNTYGRVEPYGITSVDGIDGKGTFENDSKILYGQMLKDEGLYFGQRLNPSSEYLTHISYPNIDNVKSIIFNMEKPGLYDKDLTLYEGSEYNIVLKHPYRELFTDDFENIVIINTVKNKLWINGVFIASDRYYNKTIVPTLPLTIYDSSLRVNEKPPFKKEDLIEIFGRKPIGYDTVTMNPVDGVFSNPEGTCQGQLVLEEEKVFITKGNDLPDSNKNMIIFQNSGSPGMTLKIKEHYMEDGWNVAIVDGIDTYGSELRLTHMLPRTGITSFDIEIEIENYPDVDLYVGGRTRDVDDTTRILRGVSNKIHVNNIAHGNEPQILIGELNMGDIHYNNTKIKWRNIKYSTTHDILPYTDSKEDVYETKYIKKLYYGENRSVLNLNVNVHGSGIDISKINIINTKLGDNLYRADISGVVNKTADYGRIILAIKRDCPSDMGQLFESIEIVESSRDFILYNAWGGQGNVAISGYNDHQTFKNIDGVYRIGYSSYVSKSIDIAIKCTEGMVFDNDYIIFRNPYLSYGSYDPSPFASGDVPETIIDFE